MLDLRGRFGSLEDNGLGEELVDDYFVLDGEEDGNEPDHSDRWRRAFREVKIEW